MSSRRTTPRWIPLLAAVAVLTAAMPAADFPVGTYRANDADGNAIELTFDTTGTVVAYVNGQQFSVQPYSAKGDDIEFREGTAPEQYRCPGMVGKYKWKLESNRLVFTIVEDNCAARSQPLTGLAWTKV
jgi:hypothetical protein